MFEQQDIYGNRKEPWKPDPERAHQMREKRAKREGWTTGDTDAAAENRKRRDANQQKAYDRYLNRMGDKPLITPLGLPLGFGRNISIRLPNPRVMSFDLWKARQRDRASTWHNPNTIIPQRSEDGKLIKPNTTLPDGSRLLNPYNPDDLTTDRGTANPEAAKRVRDEMRKNSPRGLGGPDSPDKW